AAGVGSLAFGTNAVANNANDVALGSGSVTSTPNPTSSVTIGGVTYGFAGVNPTSVVSVGAPGAERQITNVAAGRVSATSTDAINGSQLNATNVAVSNLSTSTSTSIGALSTGVGSLSTALSSTNNAVASLSTGMTSINSQLTQLSTTINNTTRNGPLGGVAADMNGTGSDLPLVTAGTNSVAIGANSTDGGRSNVVSVGAPGAERQVTNVAPGTQGTDAVNVNQLNAVQSTLSTALSGQQAQINSLGSQLQQTDQMAKQGIAAVGAMASIPQLDRDSNFGMGIGTSSFLGQKAMAVNMQARITDNLKASINGGFSGNQRVIGAGVLYQWK
ncbi:hypothetical protein G3N57_21660, partial [Paraburkholderia sp. Se-20369]|nr:hypothetical protein [Paraburkholderia sp. Se-20369]